MLRLSFCLLVILFFELATACHSECRWVSDDPVSFAKCQPICLKPNCTRVCEHEPIQCPDLSKSDAQIRCIYDSCEADSCPVCETYFKWIPTCVTPPNGPNPNCNYMCEMPQCGWLCSKPLNPPLPKYELVCELPACDIGPTIWEEEMHHESDGRHHLNHKEFIKPKKIHPESKKRTEVS